MKGEGKGEKEPPNQHPKATFELSNQTPELCFKTLPVVGGEKIGWLFLDVVSSRPSPTPKLKRAPAENLKREEKIKKGGGKKEHTPS